MFKIYHNPRCSKSRQTLALLEAKTKDFQVKLYLKETLIEEELDDLATALAIKPINLLRQNETIFKEKYANRKLTKKQIVKAIIKHPILLERPIVVHENKAVFGRPPENIEILFNAVFS